eukprot:TRINITY_DN10820_c0_g1_i10.p1 TRINITY_DN10820_c0_g1~~TRINITY_DN10820_c0_g1_i10.p1  ORF type:complete len:138 (+),score=21.79 TRINITY_DN10820_c0_g1_i10:233-646(+)
MSELRNTKQSENWTGTKQKEGVTRELESLLELLTTQCKQSRPPEERKRKSTSRNLTKEQMKYSERRIESPKYYSSIGKKAIQPIKLPQQIAKTRTKVQNQTIDKKHSLLTYVLEGKFLSYCRLQGFNEVDGEVYGYA